MPILKHTSVACVRLWRSVQDDKFGMTERGKRLEVVRSTVPERRNTRPTVGQRIIVVRPVGNRQNYPYFDELPTKHFVDFPYFKQNHEKIYEFVVFFKIME